MCYESHFSVWETKSYLDVLCICQWNLCQECFIMTKEILCYVQCKDEKNDEFLLYWKAQPKKQRR